MQGRKSLYVRSSKAKNPVKVTYSERTSNVELCKTWINFDFEDLVAEKVNEADDGLVIDIVFHIAVDDEDFASSHQRGDR